LKNSLNEQFRERHPQLPPSLTVSKIRNLKKSALLGCMALCIEVSTIASAVIFFERLCLKGVITKANRKLTMAVSLLLSYKFNECVTSKFHSRLEAMLDFIDKDWKISKKEVFDAEFGAFVHLGFSLLVPHQHVFLVFTRLLKLVYKSTRNYLGDDLMELYTQDILVFDYERNREHERKQDFLKMKKKKIEKDDEGGDGIINDNKSNPI
jgi:Cyclin, N-terminal domain